MFGDEAAVSGDGVGVAAEKATRLRSGKGPLGMDNPLDLAPDAP
jgi:hypothetical protein